MNKAPTKAPIWVAIDTIDMARAIAIAHACGPHVAGMKLGLEFFLAHGKGGVAAMAAEAGLPVFLDLKLHDIPNTVGKAIAGLAGLPITLLTIHAAGGAAMIAAARAASETLAAANSGVRPLVIAVTVLTSLDTQDLNAIGVADAPSAQAVRLAKLAQDSGADGVVCSPHEIADIRLACGVDFALIVPGIRPEGAPMGDQKRAMSPRAARELGATHLVIGRPITGSADMGEAAREIAREMQGFNKQL